MTTRNYPLTQVYRPLEANENGQITKTESLYVLIVDHVIGDKVHLSAPLRVAIRNIVNEAGFEGEDGFVWFMQDNINGDWRFNIPDNSPAWIDFFENFLQPEQFQNVVGEITVDMARLDEAVMGG